MSLTLGGWLALGKLLAGVFKRKQQGKRKRKHMNIKQNLIEKAARWVMAVAGAGGVVVSEDMALSIVSGLVALGSLIWSIIDAKRKAK